MMKVSFFARLAVLCCSWQHLSKVTRNVAAEREGWAVKGNRYMSKSYTFKGADFIAPPFDWYYCRDWCKMKSKCRAWEFKSNDEGGRCDLHKKGYKWVRYTGQSSTNAGRCWPN
eukprot:jgi/Picre1/35499/NNA_002960.t1